jgi:tetratricopeptide (TPR) repeat protein
MFTNAAKLAEATRLKEEGNALVQQKEFRKACKSYRRVFAYANGLVGKDGSMAQYAKDNDLLSATEEKQLNDLKVSTYTNLALCYIRLAEPVKATEAATHALEIDPNNVKALFRQGSASIQLCRWDRAKESLLQALKLDPENSAVKAEIGALKVAHGKWLQEQAAKQKALFGGKLL